MSDTSKVHSAARYAAIANYLAASLTGFFFLPALVLILELFAKVTVFKWQLPVIAATAVPFLALSVIRDRSIGEKVFSLALFVALLAASLVTANLFYDTTWDGRAYHADGILLLLEGTNPMYEMMHGFDDLWTNNYPKITWYFASVVTHLTGNYNFGKCINLLMVVAAIAYVFSFLTHRGLSTGNALLVAIAAGVNPVSLSQLHCFYIDGTLAALFALAVFSSLSMAAGPRSIDKLIFFVSSCLLINIKFTGAAYLAVAYMFTGAVVTYRWVKNRTPENFQILRELAGTITLACLLGGLVMGYNPYVTNLLVHHNPLFPLVGKGSIDVVAAQSPPTFREPGMTTAQKLLISIFSRGDNIADQGGTADPQLKVPFSTDSHEMSLFFANDIRIGGWGVLFSGILVAATLLYALSKAWKEKDYSLALIFILVGVLINPGCWWARYAPQVALLPVLMIIPASKSGERWQRISAKFILALMILNWVLIIPPNTRYFSHTTEQIQQQIDTMIAACGRGTYDISDTEGYHIDQFLMNNGIKGIYSTPDIRKIHPASALFPLGNGFVYKEGCVRH